MAKNTDLANLKSDVDILDIDKFKKNVPIKLSNLESKVGKLDTYKWETTPADLSKLRNVVKDYVVRKTEYDELVLKINTIQTAGNNEFL